MISKLQLLDAIADLLKSDRPTIKFSDGGITVTQGGESRVLRGNERANTGSIVRLK